MTGTEVELEGEEVPNAEFFISSVAYRLQAGKDGSARRERVSFAQLLGDDISYFYTPTVMISFYESRMVLKVEEVRAPESNLEISLENIHQAEKLLEDLPDVSQSTESIVDWRGTALPSAGVTYIRGNIAKYIESLGDT